MAKKRAFVRYSKQGKIVPGSLILTGGSFPNGPSTWKEVPADLCCDGGGDCSPIPIPTTCTNFNIFPTPIEFGFILKFEVPNTCVGFEPNSNIFYKYFYDVTVTNAQDVVDFINADVDLQENGVTAVVNDNCVSISISKCKCLYTTYENNILAELTLIIPA